MGESTTPTICTPTINHVQIVSHTYIYIYIRCGGAIVNLFKIYLGLHFHLKKSLCKVREILKEEGRKGRL